MTKPSNNPSLAASFAARSTDELAAHYAGWAATYDAENAAAGLRLPLVCSAFFARHVPAGDTPILDAGCGTGACGDNLAILGYRGLVGIDLSLPMLDAAASLGIYERLRPMQLGGPLDFADGHFAAVICSGVFTAGHASHDSFDELIRVTRPAGSIVFSVRNDISQQLGFRQRQDQLADVRKWRLREASEPFRPFTVSEPEIRARVFVYEVE